MSTTTIVAIRRHGQLTCKDCRYDFVESAVWASPEQETSLMSEENIQAVHSEELKGDEVCTRCGAKLVKIPPDSP